MTARLADSFVCKGCDTIIVKKPSPIRDIRSDYCSRACKLRVWWRTHKKKVYPPSSETLTRHRNKREHAARVRELATTCQQALKLCEKNRKEKIRRQSVCRICAGFFSKPAGKRGSGSQTLCVNCREPERLRAIREARKRHRDIYGKKPAERARKRGLAYERCGPIAICTRDKWRCQLCGVSTPRSLRGTYDLRAPEVDHIVPLSHPDSSGHVWANVQCLCRQCNLNKGAKILGQLRLAV